MAQVLITKRGGGVSCEHAMRVSENQDIVVLCGECSDSFLAGVCVAGTIKASSERIEYVCPHVVRLIQLPVQENGADWIQKGNTLLCEDCAKKQAQVGL
jgi:hypothetical protein